MSRDCSIARPQPPPLPTTADWIDEFVEDIEVASDQGNGLAFAGGGGGSAHLPTPRSRRASSAGGQWARCSPLVVGQSRRQSGFACSLRGDFIFQNTLRCLMPMAAQAPRRRHCCSPPLPPPAPRPCASARWGGAAAPMAFPAHCKPCCLPGAVPAHVSRVAWRRHSELPLPLVCTSRFLALPLSPSPCRPPRSPPAPDQPRGGAQRQRGRARGALEGLLPGEGCGGRPVGHLQNGSVVDCG